jgi:putative peptide maturation system protein
MDLLWEEESCDRSVHYDALLHHDGEGTVSMSYCPEKTLPWPLRGVQRWSEMNLLRVNATVLKVDQAVALLDFIWDEAPMLKRLLHAALIREALDQEPVTLSDEQLQLALDAFRRTHRLYKAADMHRWMEQRNLTQEKLECLVAELAEVSALRDRVTTGKVEAYFAAHQSDFDTVTIAQLVVADADHSNEIAAQIRIGTLDFYAAAERCFAAHGPVAGEVFRTVSRRQASWELCAAFAEPPGTVLGPLPQGAGHVIVRVLSQTRARLDEPTQAMIKELIFEQWLEERRQAASVEWYWGPTVS